MLVYKQNHRKARNGGKERGGWRALTANAVHA